MPRIEPVQVSQVTGKARQQLEGIQRNLGMVPNLFKTLAHSPAALSGYVGMSGALSQALNAKLREQVALAVAGANACDYCASAHAALGAGAGLEEGEIQANLTGSSSDDRTRAALAFVLAVLETRGRVSDATLTGIREAGFIDAEIIELVALAALNIFTNYFNHVAETDVDFPLLETRRQASRDHGQAA